jgi:hypothetical protein
VASDPLCYIQGMFSFILTVFVILPPINPIQAAHPFHSFTVQSTPSYADEEDCTQAVKDTAVYIQTRLPPNSAMATGFTCAIAPVQQM